MLSKREAFSVTAFSIAVSISACAVHPPTAPALPLTKDVVHPNGLSDPAQEKQKHLSAGDTDSDCVMTTGDIHLWCKWISRYY
jgi:hypothetical protein